jgi:tRNA(Ile)-lysidine synthase
MDWIQTKTILFRRFSPDADHLIGVSGGRDSVTLLHHLVHVGYKKLIICHLNHELRGRSSNTDARFVEKLAAKYDIDLEIGSADVRAIARRKQISIETAAREARYKFFAEIAKQRRCHTIFLAHHADDLVETFLINLFRGAGLTGLAAMREISTRRIHNVDLTIVRPFLGVWRDEIDRYVRKYRLKFREDASNKNLVPLRNRIRRRVIPYLEKTFGRNVRQNIWRTATIAAEEENWIDNQVRVSPDYEDHLNVKELRALPVALQRRTILKWLREQDISGIGFEAIERVRSLLDLAARGAKVNLPRDRHVRRRAGKLFIDL